VRFLSRYDKSANNIKESAIWAAIGQTPWSHPYSTWYHKYVEFPFQALRAASELGEYTLTDRGSWWAVEGEVRERMVLFVSVLFLVCWFWGGGKRAELGVF
jgi:ABC-type tungstate transport system permease subunit